MTTLLIAERDNASLKDATNKALAAAAVLTSTCWFRRQNARPGRTPPPSVLLAEDDAYAHDLAEPLAVLIVSQAPSYDACVAPATSRFKNVMPRVAALLDVMQVNEIIKVVAPDTPATRSRP
ncbi:hypothetical protein [Bradyrhizobium iriomotense]|uniref:Electron transfer flavoprotein alpha/beta-subunit N-terminal domain-containing protein n=1 Tax=Bradyrhizobium iriomotense TaxID=441950 RepID=A0ABQ6BJ59_9BRAD|nr:hypothetical protein GCM10007857_88730 [Bradyrhizobium iriomotense]